MIDNAAENRFCIIGAGPSGLTAAKNLKQAGIPPWLRARRPILELNGKYVWVAGLGWFSYQVIEKTEFDSLQLPEPDWVSSGADSYRQL
mgnify:CR=1 FL=1